MGLDLNVCCTVKMVCIYLFVSDECDRSTSIIIHNTQIDRYARIKVTCVKQKYKQKKTIKENELIRIEGSSAEWTKNHF